MHVTLSRLLATMVIIGMIVPHTILAMEDGELPYEDAIAFLEAQGVIDGYQAGNPQTEQYINRAEAISMIIRGEPSLATYAQRIQSSISPIPLFPDIDQHAWYVPFTETAFRIGMAKGYSDGRFWPQGGVRMSEAAEMMVRAYGIAKVDSFQESTSIRNKEGEWYTSAVSAMVSRKITVSDSVEPETYLTRGQFMSVLHQLLVSLGRVNPQVASNAVINRTSVVPAIPSAPIREPAQVASSPSVRTQEVVPTSSPISGTHIQSSQAVRQSQPTIVAQQSAISASTHRSRAGETFQLSIPSIGIQDLLVTHPKNTGTQKGVLDVLKSGVGHLFSFPGEGGKVLIYGHSSSYPWDVSPYTKIFRGINKVNIGDLITVVYQGQTLQYQVSQKKTVLAKDRSEFEPDQNGEELILYTCWPPDSITHRFLVIAKPVSQVAGR